MLMVTSRPSEDILAVYDAHGWPRNQYLWRMMGRSGLQQGETPLVTNMEDAFRSGDEEVGPLRVRLFFRQ